jgi:digeranylgeranylglycerophospholipid reductase
MKIAIIGAGPIGSYAGYLLAKSGHDVNIYERKKEIGKPVQCTGIFTSDFDDFTFLNKEKFLVNTINQTEVNFPNGSKIAVNQKEYVVCRTKFDNHLANLAVGEGAKIFLQHSFVRKEGNNLIIKDLANSCEKEINADIVIAADGPLSNVAKAYGFYHPKRGHNYGVQALVRGNFDSKTVQTFFGKDIAPGVFVWIVPESLTTARVGLATEKDARKYFEKFVKDKNYEILEMQAGTIPIYHPSQELVNDNCYLLGDAAGFVKATTLGGVIPGMKQAEVLVKCLNDSELDYKEELQPIVSRLKLHLKIRKVHDKFSEEDWEKLATYSNNPKVLKLLNTYTRENVTTLFRKIVWAEPRMLYFSKYLGEFL